jgi:DNA replication protein DnaD
MKEKKAYIYIKGTALSSETFKDASADELRALIVFTEADGAPLTADEVSLRGGLSRSRAAAAIALWLEEGVLREDDGAPVITEEFNTGKREGEINARASVDVARTIRDAQLAEMISECSRLLRRTTLPTEDAKKLTGLYEQYGLSTEYILTLTAFLTHGGERRVNIDTLVNAAIRYSTEMEISTVEALEAYIEKKEGESATVKEFRKIFGIYDRALSKTEEECFLRWSKEYGYFTEIVGEAYDLAVMGGYKRLVFQANRLLTRWYETGCRTVADCRMRYEADEAEKKQSRDAEKREKKAAAKPRDTYSDFDPEEALRLALERSFGSDDDEENS